MRALVGAHSLSNALASPLRAASRSSWYPTVSVSASRRATSGESIHILIALGRFKVVVATDSLTLSKFLSPVSFPFDPLPDVRWAVQQFHSALFALTEVTHYSRIHECQFIKVECHVRACCEGLRLEVLEVLCVNLADQLQNCSTSLRALLNPQRHVPE